MSFPTTPTGPRLRRVLPVLGPVVAATGWILIVFGRFLDPRVALASRDVPLFHLPLRTAFARLAADGLPWWNPWLHGGQPILSNPNYAAFYPPSWLVLAVEPAYALGLLVVFHAALAYAGAYSLARRLGSDCTGGRGCGGGAATLAAIAYTGGAFVGLTHAFNLLCGMAWLPWVAAAGLRLIAAETGRGPGGWHRAAWAGAFALALQLLSGEPVSVLISALTVICLASAAILRRPRRAHRLLLRLSTMALFAALFASIQLLPSWRRIRESPRAQGLAAETASVWSAPPARVIESVFPRFFGDPSRSAEGLYFSRHLHDRDFPYVVSVYPGLLLTILGLSALVLWPVPFRWGWAAAAGGGLLLGLGRYNPLYGWLQENLPVLGMVRYPEKFLLLTVVALIFAGAAGWQRLVDRRSTGHPETADLPLALACAAMAAALGLAVALIASPSLGSAFIRAGSLLPPSPGALARGLAFLRSEAWAATIATGSVVALLLVLRRSRLSARTLSVLALALLAADTWHYGHGLALTLPAEDLRRPPRTAQGLERTAGSPAPRIYAELQPQKEPLLFRRGAEPERQALQLALDRLEPYSGVLWGLGYAYHPDYDLMLTDWGQHGQKVFEDLDGRGTVLLRLLGAWGVGRLILRPEQITALVPTAVNGDPPSSAGRLQNPYELPLFRFLPAVEFHRDRETAHAAVRYALYNFVDVGHWVNPEWEGRLGRAAPGARILDLADHGSQVEIAYEARSDSFFVAAITFDPGWTARVDHEPVAIFPTGAGQIGVVVPAGRRGLRLEYRDPWVRSGAAVTLGALLASLFLWLPAPRRPGRVGGAGASE